MHKQADSYKYCDCSQAEGWRTTALTDTRPQNRLVCIRVIALVSTIYWWRGQGIHNKRFGEPWFGATPALRAPLQKINVKQKDKKGFTLQQHSSEDYTNKQTQINQNVYKLHILLHKSPYLCKKRY